MNSNVTPLRETFEYFHVVGWFPALVSTVIGRPPRAVCGERLETDWDKPGPGPDAPMCPACLAKGPNLQETGLHG